MQVISACPSLKKLGVQWSPNDIVEQREKGSRDKQKTERGQREIKVSKKGGAKRGRLSKGRPINDWARRAGKRPH